ECRRRVKDSRSLRAPHCPFPDPARNSAGNRSHAVPEPKEKEPRCAKRGEKFGSSHGGTFNRRPVPHTGIITPLAAIQSVTNITPAEVILTAKKEPRCAKRGSKL